MWQGIPFLQNQHYAENGLRARYCLQTLDRKIGTNRISIPRVTDACGSLQADEIDCLNARLNEFQHCFAALFAGLYIGSIPASISASELGFWLLNRAAVEDVDYHRMNEQGIFFVVDLATRTAAVTTGYGLEKILPKPALRLILKALTDDLAASLYARGFLKAMDLLSWHLRRQVQDKGSVPSGHAISRSSGMVLQPVGMIT